MEKYGLSRVDFIKYKDYFFKMLEKSGVQNEESEIKNDARVQSVKQKHDKSFKDILVDEEEMSKFLEQFIGIKVNVEVIPIVIYTGANKWNVETNFSDTQKTFEGYQEYKINLNYKLVDINKYSKQVLREKDTKLASMMVFEKCKTKEELKSNIIEIVLKAQDKERIEWVKQIVNYVFADTLADDANKILDVLEKGEMSDMEDLIERIEINEARIRKNLISKGRKEGRKLGRNEGVIETIKSIIKNMLQQNEDEEKIMKYTAAKREDIEAAKKELGMC